MSGARERAAAGAPAQGRAGAVGTRAERVGPVLLTSVIGHAIAESIQAANAGAVVRDRGSYLRVSVPGRCVLPRAEIERRTGRPFALPADLERVMPSFKGRLVISADAAEWRAAGESEGKGGA